MFKKAKSLIGNVMNSINRPFLSRKLIDQLTGLPMIAAFYEPLSVCLSREEKVALIYIDICEFSEVEKESGSLVCEEILVSLADILVEVANEMLKEEQIGVSSYGGDDFIIFLNVSEFEFLEQELALLTDQIKKEVFSALNQLNYIKRDLNFHSGYALLEQNLKRIENSIYKAIKEAERVAKEREYQEWKEKKEALRRLIEQKEIRIVYQALLSLKTGEVMGYEALARGPADTFFERPDILFDFAQKTDMLLDLERLCRYQALLKSKSFLEDMKLSLNVNPEVIKADDFKIGITQNLIEELNLNKKNIIFEITEREFIDNFQTFRKTVDHYRSQGYQIAVDDLGAGYSNLQIIVELSPQYIKLDMSLIRDINFNFTKIALLESFVSLAHKIGAKVVAEGIESYEELEKLIELGVDYGQGYLIQRPQSNPRAIEQELVDFIKLKNKKLKRFSNLNKLNIGNITEKNPTLKQGDLVVQAVNYFENNPQLNGLVVLEQNNKPLGLVMRNDLYYKLAKRFGVSLFMEREIELVMDQGPLIVNAKGSLESLSQIAMERVDTKLYDHIIVVAEEKYKGIVSIKRLLEELAKLQVQIAQNLNPLTNLPGNMIIKQRLNNLLELDLNLAILYVDLDDFKSFNDHYGFECGDRVIELTADILKEAIGGNEFVGHIGGDDFIVIINSQRGEEVSQFIIEEYESRVRKLILAGAEKIVNLVQPTISIAGFSTTQHRVTNSYQATRLIATLKDQVKSLGGSNYLIDN